MAKKKHRRKRSTSEKVMIVFSILIALSMLLGLFVGLGTSGRSSNTPLPDGGQLDDVYSEPVSGTSESLPVTVAGQIGIAPLLL